MPLKTVVSDTIALVGIVRLYSEMIMQPLLSADVDKDDCETPPEDDFLGRLRPVQSMRKNDDERYEVSGLHVH